MSYVVLARKYRPQTFEKMIGQETVVQALTNAVSQERVAHAYLFSGPRGVGKTTTARLLAKALNCRQGPTPSPCDACDVCKEIASGSSPDVVEIDGASNRGIDEIRDLKERVAYAPAKGRYRVFIIDEVHMLTREAFNALLKTLEEPPSHIVFVFATTEPHKVPLTVRSRCQHYPFRLLTREEISRRLKEIVTSEKLGLSETGIELLAVAARGSLRDAEGILDQVIAYAGQKPSDTDIRTVLGQVETSWFCSLIQALGGKKTGEVLSLLEGKLQEGLAPSLLAEGFISVLRDMMVLKEVSEPGTLVELIPDEVAAVVEVARAIPRELLDLWYQIALSLVDRLRRHPSVPHLLDIGFLQMMRAQEMVLLPEGTSRPPRLPSAQKTTPAEITPLRNQPPPEEKSEPGDSPQEEEITAKVRAQRPSLGHILEEAAGIRVENRTLVVGVPADQAFKKGVLEESENRAIIETMAAEILGRKVSLRVDFVQGGEGFAPPEAAGLEEAVMKKQIVRQAREIFGGRVVDIRPHD